MSIICTPDLRNNFNFSSKVSLEECKELCSSLYFSAKKIHQLRNRKLRNLYLQAFANGTMGSIVCLFSLKLSDESIRYFTYTMKNQNGYESDASLIDIHTKFFKLKSANEALIDFFAEYQRFVFCC